jgi:hypothetical protein
MRGVGGKIEKDPFSLQNNSIARNICVRKEEDQQHHQLRMTFFFLGGKIKNHTLSK